MNTQPLTANQTHALAALLSHPTREAAAKAVGVSAKTISRWLREEPFVAAYREACRDLLQQATQTLAVACVSAVETLTGIMTNPNSPAYSRIRAAKLILDYADKHLAQDDLSARITALEAALSAQAAATTPAAQPAPEFDVQELQQDEYPLHQRIEWVEERVAEGQRQAEERRLEEEARLKREEEATARWNAYLEALPPLQKDHLNLLQSALPSLGTLDVGLTACTYQHHAPWTKLKSGQRLAVWLCDRYKDHREGRPVSLHPAIAEAVIFDRDGHPKYECPHCRLRLPRLATTCPKCNIQVTKERQYINYELDSPAPQFG